MRLSTAGTLLLPPTSSAQTIVPLGSVIQQLGYRLDWTASRCRLIAPSGRAFRLRVKGGCPEIMESEALVLISKLEEKRLEDLKSLEANVAEGTSRIRAVKALMSKSWWDHMQDYVSLGSTNSAQLALQAAPFLADVPQAALQGLVEDVAQVSGWELLKGLTHLNRRRRRALLNAPEWIAKCRIFLVRRRAVRLHGNSVVPPVRGPLDLYGLPELSAAQRAKVDRETALLCRQIWLHAVATAGRKTRSLVFGILDFGIPMQLLQSLKLRAERLICIASPTIQRDGRRHVGVTHPSQFTLCADVCGPLKVPGVDPEGRSKAPKKFKYFLAASYPFPRLHGMPEIPDPLEEVDLSKEQPLDDFPEGAGVGLTEEEARDILENLSEDDGPPLPPPLHAPDDGYSPSKEEAESQDAEEEKEGEEAQEEEADDEEEALPNRGPQEGDWEFEYSDLKEPLQSDRLMFCVPLLDNKSPCVLEALQEIYLYLRALNLPVLRLHTD
ncbi:GIP, partial [Symbiodinium necroappetens]